MTEIAAVELFGNSSMFEDDGCADAGLKSTGLAHSVITSDSILYLHRQGLH